MSQAAAQWIFVDDNPTDAEAYRDALGAGDLPITIAILPPSEARKALLTGEVRAKGVLMDVDLSGEAGTYGTGLGLAQDIRAAQKSGKISEFPIIRFANPEPIQKNVGGDPASDDLFDDKIEKAEVGKNRTGVQRRMAVVESIYAALEQAKRGSEEDLIGLLGLDREKAEQWLHPAFVSRLVDGHLQATHVAAGTLCRTGLSAAGLMIDRPLLLLRLGLPQTLEGNAATVIEKFAANIAYAGIGSNHVHRWWARGLEDLWYGLKGADEALATTDAAKRVAVLSENLRVELPVVEPAATSPGQRPWRTCILSGEKSPPEIVGVDPRFAVRVTPRGEAPPWVDPLVAAYGEALRVRDPRLNASDMERLKSVVG